MDILPFICTNCAKKLQKDLDDFHRIGTCSICSRVDIEVGVEYRPASAEASPEVGEVSSSTVSIDLAKLNGALVGMLVSKEGMRDFMELGMAMAKFIGRDSPAHELAPHLVLFLKQLSRIQHGAKSSQSTLARP